jgi:hypothetical protein
MTAETTWKPTAEQRELLLDVARTLDKASKLLRDIIAKMHQANAKAT